MANTASVSPGCTGRRQHATTANGRPESSRRRTSSFARLPGAPLPPFLSPRSSLNFSIGALAWRRYNNNIWRLISFFFGTKCLFRTPEIPQVPASRLYDTRCCLLAATETCDGAFLARVSVSRYWKSHMAPPSPPQHSISWRDEESLDGGALLLPQLPAPPRSPVLLHLASLAVTSS